MSIVAPYMCRLYHSPGTLVRVWVNDLPMYDRAPEKMTTGNFPATPWFQPGENEIVIEVNDAPPAPGLKNIPSSFELLLFGEGKEDSVGVPAKIPLYDQKYPAFMSRLPPEEQKLPARWRGTFRPEGPIPEPIWADAPAGPIPENGTPELWKVMHEMHRAFGQKDVDAMIAATTLKLEDQRRYHGNHPRLQLNELRQENHEMLQEPWDLAPFEPSRMRFRSCAGGRVAYATRDDGGPALEARHPSGQHAWKFKPLLMRRGADWQIFR